jgi:hypothetical protein
MAKQAKIKLAGGGEVLIDSSHKAVVHPAQELVAQATKSTVKSTLTNMSAAPWLWLMQAETLVEANSTSLTNHSRTLMDNILFSVKCPKVWN